MIKSTNIHISIHILRHKEGKQRQWNINSHQSNFLDPLEKNKCHKMNYIRKLTLICFFNLLLKYLLKRNGTL